MSAVRLSPLAQAFAFLLALAEEEETADSQVSEAQESAADDTQDESQDHEGV